jgi:hypothetical protein
MVLSVLVLALDVDLWAHIFKIAFDVLFKNQILYLCYPILWQKPPKMSKKLASKNMLDTNKTNIWDLFPKPSVNLGVEEVAQRPGNQIATCGIWVLVCVYFHHQTTSMQA